MQKLFRLYSFWKYLLIGLFALSAGAVSYGQDTAQNLRFPLPEERPDGTTPPSRGLQGQDPYGVTTTVVFDPRTNQYILERSVGGFRLGGQPMTFDEFSQFDLQRSIQDYWRAKSAARTGLSRTTLTDLIPAFRFSADDIFGQAFGGGLFEVSVNASVELILGFIRNRRDDPAIDIRNQRRTDLNFDARMEMNLNARIGNNFELRFNHNTEALFAFDNLFRLQRVGNEDDIIKNIQAGDVSFALPTTLIHGAQSLFGLYTRLQFGNTFISAVFSEQRSETRHVQLQGGAQTIRFEFKADQYEDDRHFFIGHYFRNTYNHAMSMLPVINSNINILKIEVWVTNIGAPVTNNRNIVAFTDLGEANPNNPNLVWNGNPRPSDNTNNLLTHISVDQLRSINNVSSYFAMRGDEFVQGRDFEKVENARRLNDNEFTFNRQLGFISLNSRLSSDQVLAVAFQYQIIGDPEGRVFQVGEFSDQGINAPDALMVKLLRSSRLDTRGSLWRLMMKNVYNLNAFQVSPEDFRLNILFAGDDQGIKTGFFKDGPKQGIPLIELFGLDRMDSRQNPGADGVFDFIDNAATVGGLIESSTGRIFLPFIEPFGRDLITIFGGDSVAASRYMFTELYDMTRAEAQQFPTRNKFYFEGSFRSAASNEISIGSMNVPHGSVRVMAGNTPLIQGVDFTVDYMLGRVRIINEGILNSGVPINITSENNSMFNIMTRRMMGFRVDHYYNRNLTFGGTFMNLHQSPITQKITFGEAPINNTIWGFDVTYSNESRFLTRMVDRILPFQPSLTTSRLNLYGEFAHFIPGHSRAIGRSGTIYIDDFEGSKSSINLRDHLSWTMASTPQRQPEMFPESDLGINLATRFNAAHLSWYIIDRIFYYDRIRPRNINRDDLSDHATREVLVREVFPNRELDQTQDQRLSVLNLHFDPKARGPYNFDVRGIPGISHGIDRDGNLINPRSRWGGIQRRIDNTDFESANVEYIEFWLMDPFARERDAGRPLPRGGNLYFNLGDVSEDVLRDGRKAFEHGLPTRPIVREDGTIDEEMAALVDTTVWGRVPSLQSLVNAFDSDPRSREFQDVGLDGLNNEDERAFFASFLQEIADLFPGGSPALTRAFADPSSDDFRHFLGRDWDNVSGHYPEVRKILDRYRYFTRPQGNSPSSAQTTEDFRQQQTTRPNTEDINNDNTLNEGENYFQYVVQLRPEFMMEVGQNYITDIQTTRVRLRNGEYSDVRWFQFKIPIRSPDRVVGQIQNFQSIRFIRMFLRGWDEEVVLRFGTLELVRSEWRRYNHQLFEDGAYLTVPPNDQTEFDITTINIEENSNRFPIPYVTPPGIERQINFGTVNNILMNEQALSMRILNLADGDARAIHRLMDLDLRQFGYLRMFVHAEQVFENDHLRDDDLHLFIRLGSDFKDNYYEYSMPLRLTDWGERSPNRIWPLGNEVALDLEKLVELKARRNAHFRQQSGGAISFSIPFSETFEEIRSRRGEPDAVVTRTLTVVGNPSLSSINTIMIGVRNPRKRRPGDGDDGLPKSVEVWINELRVTDFNHRSGWAATGRAQAFLGDLGNVNISGSYTTANFGQLETRITELQQDNIMSFDFSANLELGRFLPREVGLRIPVHFDRSLSLSNPEFNPLDPDIRTRRDLETWATEEQRDRVRHQIQDEVIRTNINFMNVRRERTNLERTPQIYDISNFTFFYSYSEMRARNIDIEYHNREVHRGGFTYAYTIPSRTITPLANTAMAQNRWLALLTDFNFNPLPRSIAFNTEVMREFSEMRLRDNSPPGIELLIRPTYFKRFDWVRGYDLRWDLARSLQFDYSATAIAIIDEPLGGRNDTRERRDSVWQSVFSGGTMRNFNQTANLVWTIPINRIPIFDWISATASYNSRFRWEGALNAMAHLGNTIENANTQTIRTNFDFVRLYNRSPFLRGINMPRRATPQRPTPGRPGQQQPQQPETNQTWETLYRGFLRMLMGFRQASFEYRVTNGILLPGFMDSPTILGTNFSSGLPGLPFAFGSTRDIRQQAADMGLMSTDTLQNRPFMQKHTRSITVTAMFEPFVDFRVQLNAGMTEARNHSEFFRVDPIDGRVNSFTPQTGGNFHITTIALRTAFSSDRDNRVSPVFERFLDYRQVVAERLAENHPISRDSLVFDTATGQWFPFGFGPTSQQVLLPAFIAAYLGRSPSGVSLSPFSKIPLPNWNITYNGLTRIPFFRQHFNRISIQHGYRASFTIGAYTRNVFFGRYDEHGVPYTDFSNNFIGENLFENIVISEQFNPLLRINVEMRNNFQIDAQKRTSRNLGLSFTNNQLTESRNEDWVFSLGYVFRDVGFNIISGQSRRNITSDINVRAGVSIRSNITILRRIDQPVNLISAGSRTTTLNFSADYQLSQQFTIRLFYDQQMNRPHLPTMFFNSTTSGGISLRWTINM